MFPSSGRRTLMCSPRWEVVPQGLRESLRKLWTEQQGVGFQGCLEAGGRGGRGSREADRHGGLRKPGASPGRQRMRRKGNPTRVPEAAWHLAGPPGLLRIRSAQAFPSLTRQQKSDHGPDSGVCACKLKRPARRGGPTPPPRKPHLPHIPPSLLTKRGPGRVLHWRQDGAQTATSCRHLGEAGCHGNSKPKTRARAGAQEHLRGSCTSRCCFWGLPDLVPGPQSESPPGCYASLTKTDSASRDRSGRVHQGRKTSAWGLPRRWERMRSQHMVGVHAMVQSSFTLRSQWESKVEEENIKCRQFYLMSSFLPSDCG